MWMLLAASSISRSWRVVLGGLEMQLLPQEQETPLSLVVKGSEKAGPERG